MCSGPIVQNLSYNKGLTAASRGAGGWEKRAFISISNAETAQLRYQNRPESHRNQNAGDFTFRDEFAVDSQRGVSCELRESPITAKCVALALRGSVTTRTRALAGDRRGTRGRQPVEIPAGWPPLLLPAGSR